MPTLSPGPTARAAIAKPQTWQRFPATTENSLVQRHYRLGEVQVGYLSPKLPLSVTVSAFLHPIPSAVLSYFLSPRPQQDQRVPTLLERDLADWYKSRSGACLQNSLIISHLCPSLVPSYLLSPSHQLGLTIPGICHQSFAFPVAVA